MKNSKFHVNERMFMLDCARKYLSSSWIKSLIEEISAAGFNSIIIHFSEEMGMRLESKLYPWLAGGDHSLCVWGAVNGEKENDGKFITQDEMADIVRFAQSYGIDVIPAFDSPGHMNYVVKKYNEHFGSNISNYFHKDGKVAIVQGSSVLKEESQLSYSRGIDISNPEAVAFAKSLYEEYGKFFRELGCKSFNIGGDELLGFGETIDDSLSKWRNLDHWDLYAKRLTGNPNAVAYDAFLLYMNDICALMRSLGYESVMMWNDDVCRSLDTGWTGVVELDKSIDILYWTTASDGGKNTALFYLNQGYNIYNFIHYYGYYVLGFGQKSGVTPETVEAEWNPYVFDHAVPENNPTAHDRRIKGAGLCLWCDVPAAETEGETLEHIRPYIAAYGKKMQ